MVGCAAATRSCDGMAGGGPLTGGTIVDQNEEGGRLGEPAANGESHLKGATVALPRLPRDAHRWACLCLACQSRPVRPDWHEAHGPACPAASRVSTKPSSDSVPSGLSLSSSSIRLSGRG